MATDLTALAKALNSSSTEEKPKQLYPRPITIDKDLTIDKVKALMSNESYFIPSFDSQRLKDTDFGRSGICIFKKDTLRLVTYVAREHGKKDNDRFVIDVTLNFSDNGESKNLSFKVMAKEQLNTILESDESPFFIDQWKIGEDWREKDIIPKLEFGVKPASKKDVPEG